MYTYIKSKKKLYFTKVRIYAFMTRITLFLLVTFALGACETQNKRINETEKTKVKLSVPTDTMPATQVTDLKTAADSGQTAALTSSDPTRFKEVFGKLFTTIQTADAAAFNQFIHPDYDLYILEQPGAVPKFTKVADINVFQRYFGAKTFFSIREELTACKLQEAPLPNFNCEGQPGNPAGYAQQGCFVADAQAFRKNQAHLYAGLPPADIQQIVVTKKSLTKTVLHTATGYKFHWGNIKGQWYVLFIELITPCSA